MSLLASPVRWVGGKSRLRKDILPLIPAHHCYAEPFGGAAWTLFGKAPSAREIYNDLDPELCNFFRVLQRQPRALIRQFNFELVSRERFEFLAQQDPTTLKPPERAHRFYYLIMAGWGGELKYPRFQTAVKDAGGGNRLIGALKNLEEKLMPAHQRLQNVTIEHLDYETILQKYDAPDTFFYLDPPYPDNKCNYKENMRSLEEHQRLASALAGLKGRWLLSTYDKPELAELYNGVSSKAITSHSGMRSADGGRVVNREMLIANYPLSPLTQSPLFQEST